MLAIFSPPWLDEFHAALASAQDVPVGVSIRLGYRIIGDGEPIEYTIVVDGGEASLEPTITGPVDVLFEQTLQTAIALAAGKATAHEAFMTGRLGVEGDTQKLLAIGTEWLDRALATLREQTEYVVPSPSDQGT